jgi:hypothetical protein
MRALISVVVDDLALVALATLSHLSMPEIHGAATVAGDTTAG